MTCPAHPGAELGQEIWLHEIKLGSVVQWDMLSPQCSRTQGEKILFVSSYLCHSVGGCFKNIYMWRSDSTAHTGYRETTNLAWLST